jgi:hypothetical protein
MALSIDNKVSACLKYHLKMWLCKWCGQNDVSLHKQCGHKFILQWLKNDC